jgi:UDP-2-acetamido-3-amino-2,3-dideoxy-glucuronate N-acetyltransferase
MATKIHPTAIIEENVQIGEGTSVWDNVHIRRGAEIGEECIIGEKTYIAYDVKIGSRVKINAMVYICAAVTIEDSVMISAGTIFTNDRFPRATFPDLKSLRPSEPDEHTLPTLVKEGATIGAGCVIGNDLEIGRWAMVGMGSVVTKSVPDFHLVLGNPARSVGAVCKCGQLMLKFNNETENKKIACPHCARDYSTENRVIKERLVKWELWKSVSDKAEALQFMRVDDANFDDYKNELDSDAELIWTTEATGHDEAFQKYYDFMGWGEYKSF